MFKLRLQLVLASALCATANAAITVTMQQSGNNVVMTGSGSANTAGLTREPINGRVEAFIDPSAGKLFFSTPTFNSPIENYSSISGPSSYGPGAFIRASDSSGDKFGFEMVLKQLRLPIGYTSGSTLSGTARFNNATLASLGLTPGTYVYTWGTGANADSFTLRILAPPVKSVGITITIRQSGNNVVMTGSGTANTAGLTRIGPPNVTTFVSPAAGKLVFAPTTGGLEEYQAISGPTSYGPGGFAEASSLSGDKFGFDRESKSLFLPSGYVSGATLNGTGTFPNATLASLGISPGTYVYTWGTGANADSLTLIIPAPPVPSVGATLKIEQVGSNVVVTGSGAIKTTGLTLAVSSAAFTARTKPDIANLFTGTATNQTTTIYTGITGPSKFGSSSGTTLATSGSGLVFGVIGGGSPPALVVPAGYVSGSPLSGTSTFANVTLASLGLTPGTYVYKWGTGANADSFTVQIIAPPAPPVNTLVTVTQAGNDLKLTASGKINTTGLDLTVTLIDHLRTAGITPSTGALLTGTPTAQPTKLLAGVTGPASFGTATGTIPASSGSGDVFGVIGGGSTPGLVVPAGYVSGAPLSGTATFANTNLASLGLTPGTYVFSFGIGPNAEAFAVQIVGPAPSVSEVLDGAALTADLADGSVFIVKGNNLSPAGFTQATAPLYPTTLNGTGITLTPAAGGAAIPMLMVYTYHTLGDTTLPPAARVNQLAAVIPSTVAPGDYDLRVNYNSASSNPVRIKVVARKPGIVSATGDGTGMAQATLMGALTLIRPSAQGMIGIYDTRPARGGDRVDLWGTGLGPDVRSDTGGTSGDQTASGQIRVLVNGQEIVPLYAGRSSGYPGLDQIVFILPTTVALTCTNTVQVSAGGVLSNPVTIATATGNTCGQ